MGDQWSEAGQGRGALVLRKLEARLLLDGELVELEETERVGPLAPSEPKITVRVGAVSLQG